jgi:transcriptional regulator with XRE-family HTH domain
MEIGARIKERRVELGLTQVEVAARIEKATKIPTQQNEVSRWENDVHMPNTLRLFALADALNVDVYWLTGRARATGS